MDWKKKKKKRPLWNLAPINDTSPPSIFFTTIVPGPTFPLRLVLRPPQSPVSIKGEWRRDEQKNMFLRPRFTQNWRQ